MQIKRQIKEAMYLQKYKKAAITSCYRLNHSVPNAIGNSSGGSNGWVPIKESLPAASWKSH